MQAPQTWTNNSSNPLTISGSVTSGGNSLTIAGAGNTTLSGNLSGSGDLAMSGPGTLTLTGSECVERAFASGGAVLLAGTGSLTTGSSGCLYVGTSGPAAMTIQDAASLTTAELDVDFSTTLGTKPSTLTITGGSLHVTGPTYIGRVAMHADPSVTSAAVYQSDGTVSLSGSATVGNGTATSLYDISGGVLNMGGGLAVGGNVNGSQGDGLLNVHGSAVVNVSGGSGLLIGQDSSLATCGSVSISGGTLAVAGNVTIGNSRGNMGLGSLNLTGGTMTVSGNLAIDGNATVLLDDTNGSVATSFSGSLVRNGKGTLVIVPEHLSDGHEHQWPGGPEFRDESGAGRWNGRPLCRAAALRQRFQRRLPWRCRHVGFLLLSAGHGDLHGGEFCRFLGHVRGQRHGVEFDRHDLGLRRQFRQPVHHDDRQRETHALPAAE